MSDTTDALEQQAAQIAEKDALIDVLRAEIVALNAEIEKARLDGRISGLRWAAQRDADIAEGL